MNRTSAQPASPPHAGACRARAWFPDGVATSFKHASRDAQNN
jgi:hypothetical protein